MARKDALDDETFAGNIRDLLSASATFNYGDLASQRIDAMDYYMGRPFGDEIRGQSQVVSTDVADTIEGILPYLMKIFTGSDRVVEVDPTREENVKLAEQATDYLNWVFMKKNRGFLVLYEFFKDALLQKNGVVKYWRERKHCRETAEYKGLTVEELAFLIKDTNVTVLEHTKYMCPDPNGGPEYPCYDVKIQRETKKGDIIVKAVAPEEFVVNRRHNSLFLQDAQLVCHRSRQTRSALISMGFTEAQIDDCSNADDWLMQEEEQVRDANNSGTLGDEADFGTTEGMYLLDEIYVRMDKDGDGYDELYQVFMVGDQLLDYEETDQIPFAAITPIIMTHRFHGRSVAELIMDIQRIKSVIQRQSLNNLYLTNNPRMAVLRNMVNIPDLLDNRSGGVVRMDQLDAVTPLTVPFVARESFQVLEYFDSVKENRTGLTKYNQGMDANSLNKTATGISRIMDASKERIDLIARIFAETGVAEMFRGLLKLAASGESHTEIVRLRGEFVPMDPTEFSELYDVTVNVGLGTGNKQEEIQVMAGVMEYQKQGVQLGMVRPIHFFNSVETLMNLNGRKDVSRFFDRPPDEAKMPQPPSEQEIKSKAEVEKHQISTQASLQENLQKARIDADVARHRIETQAQSEVQVATVRGSMELQRALMVEAMKLAAGAIAKPATVGDAANKIPAAGSVDKMASSIMKAAGQFLPEHMRGQFDGSPQDGPLHPLAGGPGLDRAGNGPPGQTPDGQPGLP